MNQYPVGSLVNVAAVFDDNSGIGKTVTLPDGSSLQTKGTPGDPTSVFVSFGFYKYVAGDLVLVGTTTTYQYNQPGSKITHAISPEGFPLYLCAIDTTSQDGLVCQYTWWSSPGTLQAAAPDGQFGVLSSFAR